MRTSTITLRTFTWSFALAAFAGCGHGNSVPVEGTITLHNKPLANATVMFTSTRADGPGPFVGKTDSAGHFALGPAGKPGAGATAGEYAVLIATVASDPSDSAPITAPREIVPDRYRRGSERCTVPDEGTTTANFAM